METYDSRMAKRFSLLLDQRETQLRAVLHTARSSVDTTGEDAPHEVMDFKDVAAEQVQDTLDEAKKEHAAVELEQVLAAISRLHAGNYGNCLGCGNAIDLRRLATLPAAPLCTSCQAIAEHGPLHVA